MDPSLVPREAEASLDHTLGPPLMTHSGATTTSLQTLVVSRNLQRQITFPNNTAV